jgi:hypothetical protein
MDPRGQVGLAALLVLVAVAGCTPAAEDESGDVPPHPPAAVSAAADTAVTVELSPLTDAGVSGHARVEADGARTLITVALSGAGAGVHHGYLHAGSCAARGGTIQRLEPIVLSEPGGAESLTAVDVRMGELLDGAHAIVYHEPGITPGAAVACADLPRG